MPTSPATQNAILQEALRIVPFDGWNRSTLAQAAKAAGFPESMIDAAFPGGVMEVIELYLRQVDEQMLEGMSHLPMAIMKIREKIFSAVEIRLQLQASHKEAVRRLIAYLSLPWNAPHSLRLLYRTTDAIWRGIGDGSTDFNFYTKRMTLGILYSETLLYWLNDMSDNHQATWEFLHRRISDVMTFEKTKHKMRQMFAGLQSKLA